MIRKYICPACGEKAGVNIKYGMPSHEAFEASEREEVALGGCVIGDNDPERRCLKCEHEWRIKRRKPTVPLARARVLVRKFGNLGETLG